MKTKTTSLKAKFNSAFSLVELLVVIAVIAVIAAIAIPNITGTREAAVAVQESADAKTLANLQHQVQVMRGGDAPTEQELRAGVVVSVPSTGQSVTFKLE